MAEQEYTKKDNPKTRVVKKAGWDGRAVDRSVESDFINKMGFILKKSIIQSGSQISFFIKDPLRNIMKIIKHKADVMITDL